MRKIITKGKKIYLTELDVMDAEEYVKWLQNPSVTKGLGQQDKHITLEEEQQYLQRLIDNKIPSFTIVRICDDKILLTPLLPD